MLKKRIISSLAIVGVLLFALSICSPVMASYQTSGGTLYLYDSGDSTLQTTGTNWSAVLPLPSYVGLDDYDGYWNFTCSFPTNDTATLVRNFTVTLYIDDGTTNISGNSGSVTTSITGTVWGNISIAEATYEALTANSSASLWIKLYDDDSSTTNDTFKSTIRIDDYGFIGMVWALIPIMVAFTILSAMMGMIGGTKEGKRKRSGNGKKSGKGKKR